MPSPDRRKIGRIFCIKKCSASVKNALRREPFGNRLPGQALGLDSQTIDEERQLTEVGQIDSVPSVRITQELRGPEHPGALLGRPRSTNEEQAPLPSKQVQ